MICQKMKLIYSISEQSVTQKKIERCFTGIWKNETKRLANALRSQCRNVILKMD